MDFIRRSNILILIIIIAAIIIHLADIKISGTVVIAIILLVWAAIIDWNFTKLRKSFESKIDLLEEKIEKQEEKDEIDKFSKMSSFVCKVSVGLSDLYLLDKMKELGFDPKKDFEQSSYGGGFSFQHVNDFVSGLDFMNIEGSIHPDSYDPGYIFMDVKIKNGVLKNKYPNDSLIEIGNNYLLMVALKGGRIEFLHFDANSEQFRYKKVIGYFPYQYFINQLIKFHKRDFSEDLEGEDKLKMERDLLSQKEFKGWKHQQRIEPDFYLEKDAYHVTHEEPWENYWFESDYATIFLDFKPNRIL